MPDEPQNISFSDRKVTTVSPKDTTEIALRLMDWKRIYHKVKSICPATSNRELFSGVAWGVTASAVFALISFYSSAQATDAWVKPTCWLVAAASLIIGLVVWFCGKNECANVERVKGEILQDMKDIHQTYFPTDNLDES